VLVPPEEVEEALEYLASVREAAACEGDDWADPEVGDEGDESGGAGED
jgi:hypothetical protein